MFLLQNWRMESTASSWAVVLVLACMVAHSTSFQLGLPRAALLPHTSNRLSITHRAGTSLHSLSSRGPGLPKHVLTASAGKGGVELTEKNGESIKKVKMAKKSEASLTEAGVPSLTTEGYIVVGLCCLCGMISSLDRMAMSVAIVPLSQELAYSETAKGSVSSIFSIGYTIALVPLALAQAVASPKLIMAFGVGTWSLLTLLTPVAAIAGVPTLLAVRMGVGAAEAVTVPTVQTFVSRWVPKMQRSRALSVLYSCLQGGTILALLIAPKLVEAYDWPAVFETFGIFGFIWLPAWLHVAKDYPTITGTTPFSTAEQYKKLKAPIVGSPNSRSPAATSLRKPPAGQSDLQNALSTAQKLPWKDFINSKGLWATTFAHAANNWGLYVSLAWLPTFFTQRYGMDLSTSSMYSILPFAAGALTSGVAGIAADKLQEQGMDSTTVRKIIQGVGSFGPMMCMAALSQVTGLDDSADQATALFVAAVALGAASSAGFGASLQDISGRYSGLLYGLTSVIASITGAVGVYQTGRILDETQSWGLVFTATGAIYGIGGLLYTLMYDASPLFPQSSEHADKE